MISKILLISSIFLVLFVNKCGDKPGEGEIAKRGFALSQPVVEALEKYHQENNRYPQSLPELLPKYLKEIPKDGGGLDFTYNFNEQKKSFTFKFSYSPGIGLDECTYYSNTKEWSCSGKI